LNPARSVDSRDELRFATFRQPPLQQLISLPQPRAVAPIFWGETTAPGFIAAVGTDLRRYDPREGWTFWPPPNGLSAGATPLPEIERCA
jgi:hypothetical protein